MTPTKFLSRKILAQLALLAGAVHSGCAAATIGGLAFLPYMSLGTNVALGVTNTPTLTYAFWLNGTYDQTNPTNLQGVQFWSNPASNCEVTGGPAPGLCGAIDSPDGRFQMSFNNSAGVNNNTDAIKFEAQAGSDGIWHHYLVSMDTVNRVSALYFDGANTGVTANPLPQGAIPDLNNSGGFHISGILPNSTGPSLQYVSEIVGAEVSIVCTGAGMPKTMNGISVTCSGANTIPPEILAKFINSKGKPVNLGSRCQNPFGGRVPEICVRSDKPSNLGSGGALMPLVQNASYGGVYPAPYGPKGIPKHQATMKWLQAKNAATVSNNSMTTSAGSMPIAAGDLIVIWAGISNSSGTTDYGMTCPSGFKQVGPVNDTSRSVNSVMCYKKLTHKDNLSGAYTISWSSGGAGRCHDWAMADYTHVRAVDQAGLNYNGPTSTTSHLTAGGLTTKAANETVVSAWVDFNANADFPFDPPNTGVLRYRLPDIGSPLQIMFVDEYAVPSGSDPQRTMTTADGVTSAGYTITLIPK
ncbi:MAG TPA: hypothetical protein VG819_07645 [Rhizomicrobium sp.]|jgi:hypothetical protein|nr:hypothetical protein [Rhizomicrobium sp.]